MQDMRKARRRGTPGARGETTVLAVERLAAGGDGVGHIDAKVAFVPQTAPGDLVEVGILEERRTWCRGRVIRLLKPGPDRVKPLCQAFGDCGGCDWQHLGYPAQLAAKRSIVEDALRRIGRLDPPEVTPTIPSPLEYGYRHRARLHSARRGEGARFGFFRRGSHDVVPLEACSVLHPALNAVIGALAVAGRLHPQAFAHCGELCLDTGWDGATARLLLHGMEGEPLTIPEPAARFLREAAAARGIRLLIGVEAFVPLPLGPGPEALVATGETFTQVNLRQNLKLVEVALDLASPVHGEEILDLCCGLGNLAVPAAARGGRVTGVDIDGEAVRQARENACRLGFEATFVRDDAAAAARALAGAGRRFPLVLLNPPRTGAREAAAAIPALAPSRIVVVSCDPATQARDAAVLVTAGYVLEAVRPVDLFPQTAQVETVTLFRSAPCPGGGQRLSSGCVGAGPAGPAAD
jgi:23S rRNA (uracil1939-C5)-methyltransferase